MIFHVRQQYIYISILCGVFALHGISDCALFQLDVKLLLGVLKNSSAMLGVIDLGGGSVQITFHSEVVQCLLVIFFNTFCTLFAPLLAEP